MAHNIKNSPGLVPIGVLDPSLLLLGNFPFQLSLLSTFLLAFFPSGPFFLFPQASYPSCFVARVAALGTRAARTTTPAEFSWPGLTPSGDHWPYLFNFLNIQVNTEKKNNNFRTLEKRPRWQNKSALGRPRRYFSSKNMICGFPFGIFFLSFSKIAKL